MASIQKRNKKYCVVYTYKNSSGKKKQKWETYDTRKDAENRKKEIEYKESKGKFVIPKCRYMRELLKEYVDLYGKERWALSTYDGNESLIRNYILPFVGDVKLSEISTLFLEKYYKKLLETPAVINPALGKAKNELVSTSTIRDIHKLLKSCFKQAVKWELMEKNPATLATVPKHKAQKREIWEADTLTKAMEVCEDDFLNLAINLAFAGTLRIGELLGLTWDCIEISEAAVASGNTFMYVNKELQRVSKKALKELDAKDILLIFPNARKNTKTVRVLKTPKNQSSVRKVFLPRSVAQMLQEWKAQQDEVKEILGEEYQDYGLVLANTYGMPKSDNQVRNALDKLIEENNLPKIVFHSMRHTSVTYKLKLSQGDIKAVQGDSGHAQSDMVTDTYSHIIDSDRKKNAELIEEEFYRKRDLERQTPGGTTLQVPEGVDADALAKVLANPEMMTLLASLVKTMDGK